MVTHRRELMSDAVLGLWDESVPVAPGAGIGRWTRTARLAVALLSLCAVVAIGLAAVPRPRDAAPPVVVAAVPPPTWLEIVKPVQIFSLQAGELASLPLVYSARRRSDGGGREDVLTFGALANDKPALRLRIFRANPSATPIAPPLYVALARQAAEADVSVGRSGLPDLMRTRFGSFEIADIALTGSAQIMAPSVGAKAACSGFRLVNDNPALTITGLACGGAEAWPRKGLSCLLDRLDLASGGDDRQVIDFFASTELKRDAACGGMRLGPDTVHAPWLDDKPATRRKSLRHH